MAAPISDDHSDFCQSFVAELVHGIAAVNYKNGAFASIEKDTPWKTAIDMIMESTQVSQEEKQLYFSYIKRDLLYIDHKKSSNWFQYYIELRHNRCKLMLYEAFGNHLEVQRKEVEVTIIRYAISSQSCSVASVREDLKKLELLNKQAGALEMVRRRYNGEW